MRNHFENIRRSAKLTKNPEDGNCPNCGNDLTTDKHGDTYCLDFSLDYEKTNGCFWHRYKNELNYWSDAEDLIQVLSAEHGIPMP